MLKRTIAPSHTSWFIAFEEPCFYKGCTPWTPTKTEKQSHFPIATLVFVVSFKVSITDWDF